RGDWGARWRAPGGGGVQAPREKAPAALYPRRKGGTLREPAAVEPAVDAHLCEVLWLGPPQESDRHPSWFSPEKTKRRLREDRTSGDGAELARVVDRAVARIHRLGRAFTCGDALQ